MSDEKFPTILKEGVEHIANNTIRAVAERVMYQHIKEYKETLLREVNRELERSLKVVVSDANATRTIDPKIEVYVTLNGMKEE